MSEPECPVSVEAKLRMWVQVMYPTPLATNLLQSKTLGGREPARCRLACRGVQGGGPSDED
jgi:hypothetical protein